VADGPNLFYSRRIAKLSTNFSVLVPGATEIDDIVSIPTKHNCPISLVLRDILGEIDDGLDAETMQRRHETPPERISSRGMKEVDLLKGCDFIEHCTIIGECFVEGMMHK